MQTKHETPQLLEIGNVDQVILGIASWGGDIDGLLVIGALEFKDDSNIEFS